MKNTLRMIFVLACFIVCGYIEGHAATVSKQDMKVIKGFVKQEYGTGYRVRIAPAEKTPDRVLENRKGKHIVYVDSFVTRSHGKYGIVTTKGPFAGRHIKYAKRVKPGKRVVVYWIYNPTSNYTDDVAAVVSAGTLK